MQGIQSPGHARRVRSATGPIAQHVRPRRHPLAVPADGRTCGHASRHGGRSPARTWRRQGRVRDCPTTPVPGEHLTVSEFDHAIRLAFRLARATASQGRIMTHLWAEIRHNPLLWLLVFVPAVFGAHALRPESHTLLFLLSILGIVPLAALLSHATESVAATTGDAVGGLLNATLGNLTELVIRLAALRAGEYMLVKASIVGAIVTNALFMLGASFLLGGLKHHVQEFNRGSARLQAGLLFLATVALLIPSVVNDVDAAPQAAFTQTLSLGLSVLLMLAYTLGLVFSLKTHKDFFGSSAHAA